MWQLVKAMMSDHRVRPWWGGVELLVALPAGCVQAHVSGSGDDTIAGVLIADITQGYISVIARLRHRFWRWPRGSQ